MSFITVMVAGKAHHYNDATAEFGDFRATGGTVQPIAEFIRNAKANIRTAGWVTAVTGWVVMDDSTCAYRVEVGKSGHHRVIAAAPTVCHQDVYTA